MSVAMIAFHYPKAEHREQFVARVRQARDVLRSLPGCLGGDCWQDDRTGAVVTIGAWENAEARAAGFRAAATAGVDFAYDEREERPRQMHSLTSL